MPLNPDIEAVVRLLPALPPLESLGAPKLRELLASRPRPRELDVPLRAVEDREIEANGTRLKLRVYTPEREGPSPLVVYYHGGGYVIGDLNTGDAICRSVCYGAGCMVVSVDYRLAPEHKYPIPNNDCWAALNWIVSNAASLGADPARTVLLGDSAGANYSAGMTLRAREAGLPLSGQALLYPTPDAPSFDRASFREFADGPLLRAADSLWYTQQYIRSEEDKANPDAYPARAASHAGLPPAFLGLGGCDCSRDVGLEYANKLIRAGVPVECHVYEGMPHGFYSFVAAVPAVQDAMAELCGWIKARVEWLTPQ
jgi:acetyl esterase